MMLSKSKYANVMAKDVAITIAMLDNYDGTSDFDYTYLTPVVSTKVRDLACGENSCRRDLLKFYRKRITCKCLKKMHLEARETLPKMGKCFHCHEVKERALLMVCSRCRFAQYCSRECQIAKWPSHKRNCNTYVVNRVWGRPILLTKTSTN